MNGVVVIVAYRPKLGKANKTVELVRSRVPTLRNEGLVTDRTPLSCVHATAQSSKSRNGNRRKQSTPLHKNPNVLAIWSKFFAVCDCVPLNTLPESAEMFAGFEPIAD